MSHPRPSSRRWTRSRGVAVLLLALTGLAIVGYAAVYAPGRQSDDGAPARPVSGPAEQTYLSVPQDDVDEVHLALHGLGEACAGEEASPSESALETHVSVILDFVRRYPSGRFQLGDESGSSLALLIVLQDELEMCGPSFLPRVRELLPPELRPTARPMS